MASIWRAARIMVCVCAVIIGASASVIAGAAAPPSAVSTGGFSGRLQWISMYRDYSDLGKSNGSNATAGVELAYLTPQYGRLQAGLTYDVAGNFAKNGNDLINCNEDINVLNEAWLGADLAPGWQAKAGRQVVNGEVFRADPFRQKSRSLEALTLQRGGDRGLKVMAGHAIRLSNWTQDRDWADFNDFGDVFRTGENHRGVTWVEAVHRGWDGLELAMFDAHADEVVNLVGTRAKWSALAGMAVLGFYRHEEDVSGAGGGADAFGMALEQKMDALTVECGTFSVRGQKLKFQETTTGLNHPLGSLMLMCDDPYAGGADTGYLTATCPLGRTLLYGLYAYTRHEELPFAGHELNLVAKRALTRQLSVAVKLGLGLREPELGESQQLTDARVFMTYLF